MADITKCSGVGCRVKDKCYRFFAPDSYHQSYFAEPPLKVENNVLICNMCKEKDGTRIFNSIKEIFEN